MCLVDSIQCHQARRTNRKAQPKILWLMSVLDSFSARFPAFRRPPAPYLKNEVRRGQVVKPGQTNMPLNTNVLVVIDPDDGVIVGSS